MDAFLLQEKLFSQIKTKLGESSQWVDEVAEILSLSKPAVYKRISGSTALSLGDLALLMKAYNISFDALIHTDKLSVEFSFPSNNSAAKGFLDFLEPIKFFVSNLSKLPEVSIWHATSELHLFYYFLDKDLTNFKMFLHAKTLWNLKGYENIKYSIDNFSGSNLIQQEISEIVDHYFSAPNIELWNENILNNTLNQIKYFLISGNFEKPEEALILCEKMRTLLHHLKSMAEKGKKFKLGKEPSIDSGDYILYHNELSYTNNLMLVISPSQNSIFTTYNNPNFMISENETLVEYTKNWFQRVKSLSQPVSLDANQSRMMLFKQIEKKINFTAKEIEYILETSF